MSDIILSAQILFLESVLLAFVRFSLKIRSQPGVRMSINTIHKFYWNNKENQCSFLLTYNELFWHLMSCDLNPGTVDKFLILKKIRKVKNYTFFADKIKEKPREIFWICVQKPGTYIFDLSLRDSRWSLEEVPFVLFCVGTHSVFLLILLREERKENMRCNTNFLVI